MSGKSGVFIYSSEFLPFKGGVGRYTEEMAAMLATGDLKTAVFTETRNREGYPDSEKPYRVFRLPLALTARHPWVNLFINAVTATAAVLRARLGGYQWFVATGKRSVYNTAYLGPLLRGMRVAVVLHGSEWSDITEAQGWREDSLRKAVLRLCQSASHVIIPNRFTIARFREIPDFGSNRILLLYPVIDPERVVADRTLASAYRERWFREHALNLITVARLTPRKGQDQVIRALGRFRREGGAPTRYFVVGSGSYSLTLRELAASEGVTDCVVFLPEFTDKEAYALVSLCDLFVMPNREHQGTVEGFGIAFLEANVLGIPALAGRSGGSTEAVEDGANGLVCDGDDPDDVYRAIRRYIDEEGLSHRLRAQCRSVALERYSSSVWKHSYQAPFREG